MEQDYTQPQYEAALLEAGFTREGWYGHHVSTILSNGDRIQICEAAAIDMFDTLRETLADLIATRKWEEEQNDR
jgi:hypothetical protein